MTFQGFDRGGIYVLRAVLVALLLTMVVPPAPGVAVPTGEETVVFDGSGWGHGVGLSQYGAHGMAVTGSTADQIVSHYYAGSSVTVVPTAPIWVNLERDFSTLQLIVGNVGTTPGTNVTITSGATELTAVPGATITINLTTPGCSVSVVNPGQAAIAISDPACVFDFQWYAWSTPGQTPTTKISISGCTLADWNVSPTVHRPCEYARGMLHLRTGPGGLDLSAEMLIDDYVLGTSEMPYAWETQALHSQAIASRSYAVARQLERGDPATNSCDGWCHVKDTTADQRYVGWGHGNVAPWIAAVQATAGQIVHHPQAPNANGVVTAYFSSSSGGNTENVEERFGGVPRAYLTSVDDSVAVDGTVFNPNSSWQVVLPASVVAAAVGLDQLYEVEITETRSGSGSAAVIQFTGSESGQLKVVENTGTWTRTTFGLKSEYIEVTYTGAKPEADEMFFYSNDGTFGFYNVNPDASLGSPILTGSGYTTGWDAITAVDLDGDGQDEMFFYRKDGLFRFYDVKSDGSLGSPILSGTGYTTGWDGITAVDLDGDGQDEMFFYRKDGLFRYYDVRPDGSLPQPLLAGSGYTKGWDAITAVDLDGDGQDEMFFYRDDGLFRYYNVRPDGSLPQPLLAGDGYSSGWSVITAVDLDGDGQDEMFFYRDDGLFRYYNVSPNGSLGAPLLAGADYTADWSSVTAIQLDHLPN